MQRSSAFDGVIDDLVVANRILAGHGVLDGFGHVSAHPDHPDRYLLSRSLALALVTADDIVAYDLHSQPSTATIAGPTSNASSTAASTGGARTSWRSFTATRRR